MGDSTSLSLQLAIKGYTLSLFTYRDGIPTLSLLTLYLIYMNYNLRFLRLLTLSGLFNWLIVLKIAIAI
jgi:hypothetical protein